MGYRPTPFILSLLCFLLCSANAWTQDIEVSKRPRNIISASIWNQGVLYGIAYERVFPVNDIVLLSTGTGVGWSQSARTVEEWVVDFFTLNADDYEPFDYVAVPIHFSANIGRRKAMFEFGLGGTIYIAERDRPTIAETRNFIAYPIIGLRLHPIVGTGFSFRFSASWPIRDPFYIDVRYVPLGFNFGVAF